MEDKIILFWVTHLAIVVISFLQISKSSMDGLSKCIWILVVLLFPIIGFLSYAIAWRKI